MTEKPWFSLVPGSHFSSLVGCPGTVQSGQPVIGKTLRFSINHAVRSVGQGGCQLGNKE